LIVEFAKREISVRIPEFAEITGYKLRRLCGD